MLWGNLIKSSREGRVGRSTGGGTGGIAELSGPGKWLKKLDNVVGGEDGVADNDYDDDTDNDDGATMMIVVMMLMIDDDVVVVMTRIGF